MQENGPQNLGGDKGETPRADAGHFEVHIPEEELTDIGSGAVYSQADGQGAKGDNNVLNSYSSPPPSEHVSEKEQKRAEKQEEKAHRRRNRQKGKRNRRIFKLVWLVMVIFAGLALAQYLLVGVDDALAVNKNKLTVTVEIPNNPTVDQVARVLFNNGVIEKPDFFTLYSKVTKSANHFKYGTFKLDTNMDYEAIINHLQSDTFRMDTVKVTFSEGLNVTEIAALLEKNGVCSAKDVLKYANSSAFDGFDLIKAISNNSERYYKLEGYLFPDTYDFYVNEDPQDALSKLLRNCDKKITDKMKKQADTLGMSMDEVLTMASIIEAEAANKADMYVISSILHNRLESGVETGTQQLGCDSTVYYPYRRKSEIPSNLRDTFKSRYDTYEITGLPPGPICNPGENAIDAALHPEDTGYYYFCHDKDGKAYYAKTAQQHEKNLVKAGLK